MYILSALRKLKRRPLNILCMPTHERYESLLAKTGHNFYSVQFPGMRQWAKECGNPPDNYKIVPGVCNNEGVYINAPDIKWDWILSQEKTQQYPLAVQFSRNFNTPLICLEHTGPLPNMDKTPWQHSLGNQNIFITEWSKQAWEMEGTVINHGIDTDTFSPSNVEKENVVLSVVQKWKERDIFCGFSLWEGATKDIPTRVVGDNPGLSEQAADIDELLDIYRKSAVFLNTSQISPVPTALLEAMSCGMAVISTSTCEIPNIIKDGENGLLADSPDEIAEACKRLLNNTEERIRLGEAARQTILENYNERRFIESWNNIFYG